MTTTRRGFLAALPAARAARAARPVRILLRSGWQSVNIGDIGHTPGALSILWKHIPEAEITLWPVGVGREAREMLARAYPRLKIAEGKLDEAGRPATAALSQAWEECGLYLSGSGSGFPASGDAVAFHRATGKPVGVFGVSTDPVSGFGPGRDPEGGTLASIRARALKLPPSSLYANLRYITDRAAFFFCRDTISLDYLKAQGVRTPILEFGPDAQLGMHIKDDARGLAYMKAHGLEEGRFLCVVPRLRYTPYYRIRKTPFTAEDAAKDAINERTVERDHAKLRLMIAAYVRQTGNKVLACPEMTYQIELAKTALVDPLPEDVRRKVVWRDSFWLPDEAASVYARAEAVISMECHSPLIALANGTPGIYVRQPTDTCKGQMYRDFGAGDWLFEVDEARGPLLWSCLLEQIVRKPLQARAKVKSIMAQVEERQRRMAEAAREACLA